MERSGEGGGRQAGQAGRCRRPSRPAARGSGEVALERALSKLGLATRAEARALVRAGRVTVHGQVLTDPLAPIVPERSRIAIDGRPAERPEPLTVLLNKPRGVLTTRSDPRGRPTVYSCLHGCDAHLVPVGRLDAATAGLLLMTNDTRLADWLTDPAHGVPRVYLATVRGLFTAGQAQAATAGVVDAGEVLTARSVAVRKPSRRETHLVVELTEGKNREIRRLFAALGHPVTALSRVAFGGLALGALAPGAWRAVPLAELAAAFPGAPLRGAALPAAAVRR